MDILCFQGVRPFRLEGGELSWTSFTSKGYDPLGWGGELSWTSFTSKGYDPLGWRGNYLGHLVIGRISSLLLRSFTSKGCDILGWEEL